MICRIVLGLLALGVFLDARRRGDAAAWLWAVGSFVVPPVVVAIYLARRPLLPGETRRGGRAWNVAICSVVTWTVFLAVGAVVLLTGDLADTPAISRFAQEHGETATRGLLAALVGVVWLAIVVPALLIGLVVRRPDHVERSTA